MVDAEPALKLRASEWLRKLFRTGNPLSPPSQVFKGAKVRESKATDIAKVATNESEESFPDKLSQAIPGLAGPLAEPNTAASQSAANQTCGLRNECKTLDSRYNSRGICEVTESTNPFDNRVTYDEPAYFSEYCFVVTRHFDQTNKHIDTKLKIQSPLLINVLRSIVKYYPDNPVGLGHSITVLEPPALLYHYRNELSDYAKTRTSDKQTQLHIEYALTYLKIQMGTEIQRCAEHLALGIIKQSLLWMIFRPGCLVYQPSNDQLYFLRTLGRSGCGFDAKCTRVNFDGRKVGKEEVTIHIPRLVTTKEIASLCIMPLEFHADPEGLKARLMKRANRFLQLRAIQSQHHLTQGRVMVDCQQYLAENSEVKIILAETCACSCPVCLHDVSDVVVGHDDDPRQLNEDDLLLCPATVHGFSFSRGEWAAFRIDELCPVSWQKESIHSLVIDKDQKKLLLSLVTSPIFLDGICNGAIERKGNGLVVMLHGSPGTGKTLTAECVGESLERPVYAVSAGELGTNPDALDRNLKKILHLSARWKAITLIDEADVFVGTRSKNDICRNGLASVFLRRLEYFNGMLFLTTNRVASFDSAFTSRVHLALNYPGLTAQMRREVWINSLKRFHQAELAINMDRATSELSSLAEVPLNGRIIAYAVRTGKALADANDEKLGVEHLRKVIPMYENLSTDSA